MNNLNIIGENAKKASFDIIDLDTQAKNNILKDISESLVKNCEYIIEENKKDVDALVKKGATPSFVDRLTLTKERIADISSGVMQVISLKDPINEVVDRWERPNGLVISKKRVPLGVIGIIYEARPNVTVDAAALCIKSSNVCILRGGSEALNSNIAIINIMREAVSNHTNPDIIQLVMDPSRETAVNMMKMNEYIDVLIPRGGKRLIKSVVENATVPVIETGTGNCHIYVDEFADVDMGVAITYNAKTNRPSVCNAAESLLVHKNIADKFLPRVAGELKGVEIRGCERTCAAIKNAIPATEEDYYTEFLGLIISVKVVDNIDEAITHINKHGTKHSEAIVTENKENADRFLSKVDAAAVYVNASTRWTDGFEFGFGAEIGISTQKMHARGPMGLNELTSIKYVINGNGQIR